jgi:Amino acid kinase family
MGQLPILPKANVIKIGGQSFIDRGKAAVFPLLEEIVENLGRHEMIIGTGGGSRARHAYSFGLDLGLPTGVLGVLGTFVSMQSARMLNYLLAKHGIPFIEPAQFAQLPHYLAERGAVIFFGMPPNGPPCRSSCRTSHPNPCRRRWPSACRTSRSSVPKALTGGARVLDSLSVSRAISSPQPNSAPRPTRRDRCAPPDRRP